MVQHERRGLYSLLGSSGSSVRILGLKLPLFSRTIKVVLYTIFLSDIMRITLILATAKELQLQSKKIYMAADIIIMMILQYRCLFLRERIFINSRRLTPKLKNYFTGLVLYFCTDIKTSRNSISTKNVLR